MLNSVSHVYRSVVKEDKSSLNILYFSYDGIFEEELRCTGFNYYSCINHSAYQLKDFMVSDDRPEFNVFSNVLVDDLLKIHSQEYFDLVICNEKRDQARKARAIAARLHLPLLIIEHDIPPESASKNLLAHVESQVPRASRVSTSQAVNDQWSLDHRVIPRGVSPMNYDDIGKSGVVIVGDFIVEDTSVIRSIADDNKGARVYDGNEKVAHSYGNQKALQDILLSAKIFINMGSQNQPSIYMLMAMAAGCVVVSNETPWVNDIINDENGLLIKHINEIKGAVEKLQDEDLYKRLQDNGYDTIVSGYNSVGQIDNWIEAIQDASRKVYIR